MADQDWDSKVVVGFKAKAPKVARNTSDLNGTWAFVSREKEMPYRLTGIANLQLYVSQCALETPERQNLTS
jgi:hypothetical protein